LRISDPVTGSHFTSFTLGTCLIQTIVFIGFFWLSVVFSQ
jgi:membrane-associated PAP2 superfamily phosphatase